MYCLLDTLCVFNLSRPLAIFSAVVRFVCAYGFEQVSEQRLTVVTAVAVELSAWEVSHNTRRIYDVYLPDGLFTQHVWYPNVAGHSTTWYSMTR